MKLPERRTRRRPRVVTWADLDHQRVETEEERWQREARERSEKLDLAAQREREIERREYERRRKEKAARDAERAFRASLTLPLQLVDVRQFLGVVGSLLLVLGAFAPLLGLPLTGTITYIGNGTSDGLFVLLFAVVAIVITLFRRYIWLLLPAGLTLALAIFTFLRVLGELNKAPSNDDNSVGAIATTLTQTAQLQWGWAVLLAGVFLLALAALIQPPEAVQD